MTTVAKVQWHGEVAIEYSDLLPNRAGLYCLYDGDSPLYVGKSRSIWQRWQAHEVISRLDGTETNLVIRWYLTGEEPTLAQEQAYINALQPTLNRAVANAEFAATDDDRLRLGLRVPQRTINKLFRIKQQRRGTKQPATYDAIVTEMVDQYPEEALDAYMKEAK